MADELWYTALVVSNPIYDTQSKNGRVRKVLVVEAGADLLAGPYPTERDAKRMIPQVRARLFRDSRRTWFAEYYHVEVELKPVRLRREHFTATLARLLRADPNQKAKIPSNLAKHYYWPPPLAWDVCEFDPRRIIAERQGRDTTGGD
jgi:hypothetical protein